MYANDMRKYMKVLSESNTEITLPNSEFLNEAQPMGMWQKLKNKANILDAGRNEKNNTGQRANEEFKEWQKYLGSIHTRMDQATIGDIRKFFDSRGFPPNVVNDVFKNFVAKAKGTGIDVNTLRVGNPKDIAQKFLQIIINTQKEIGHNSGPSDIGIRGAGAVKQRQDKMAAQKAANSQQPQQKTQQQQTQQPRTAQDVLKIVQGMSVNDQKALAIQLANLVGTPIGQRSNP